MQLFKKSIILLSSFLICIYISELVCSYFKFYADTFPVKIKSDKNLPYLMESNQLSKSAYKKTIFINKYGYRDSLSKQYFKDAYRIMVLGDSSTFGWGLNFEETYPYFLKNELMKKNKKNIEVFNLGHPGFNLIEYHKLYLQTQKKIKPNLIVIGMNSNDYQTSKLNLFIKDGIAREYNSIWYKIRIPSAILIKLRDSSLYLTIRNAYKNLKKILKSNSKLNYKIDQKAVNESKEKIFSILSKFGNIASENKIPIYMVYWPVDIEIKNKTHMYPEFLNLLKNASNRYDNMFFYDIFNEFVNSKQEIYNKFDLVHPSKYGHILIAKKLAESIQLN